MALFTINNAAKVVIITADDYTFNFSYNSKVNSTDFPGLANSMGTLFGNSFLSTANYQNSETGNLLDCNIKIKITQLPTQGVLYLNNTTPVLVNDEINYCDLNTTILGYFPKGKPSNDNISGNFINYFLYKIIDQNGNISENIKCSFNMTDVQINPTITANNVVWESTYNSSIAPVLNILTLVKSGMISNYINTANILGETNIFDHIEITSLPNSGQLYTSKNSAASIIGDTSALLYANDKLEFYMGGITGTFNGSYSTFFTFKIVDNYGNKSANIVCTLHITDVYCATISSINLETTNI